MATGTYKRKRVTPPKPAPEPLRLTMDERWALERANLIAAKEEAKIELAAYQREVHLAKIDPNGVVKALESRMKAAAALVEIQRERHAAALAQVQQRLGIGAFSFDPETGIVTAGAVSAQQEG